EEMTSSTPTNIPDRRTYHSVGSAWTCLSNTPLRLYKHFNHEGGNCSPLIAHWPAGIKQPDRWVRDPVHLIDYMATVCDLAGAEYPDEFNGESIIPLEGVSLRPLLEGSSELSERSLFFDHNESSAIRSGDWKLVRGNRRYKNSTWELYNLAEDRCETNDLISTHPEKAKKLEDEWLAWAKRVKVFPYFKPAQKPAAK
ncbi:MAG: sulfatase/phosphatase domain-containing protein, partial [Verrucomicrobiota bacterium]